jgi:hypothetical protein
MKFKGKRRFKDSMFIRKYKNEYRIFKPVEITVRRGLR